MLKIALVSRKSKSNWVSCRSITENLRSSYLVAYPGNVETFQFSEDLSPYEARLEAERIRQYGPSVISFIDHAPHPAVFLECLSEVYGRCLPRIVVHVFGDFTLHPNQWLGTKRILAQSGPVFVCASERQAKLVRSFIRASANAVEWIPFPVNSKEFFVDSAAREKRRSDSGHAGNDYIFLYAGRLSAQKNVLLLLKVFSTYLRQINPNAYLWLAGPVDEIRVPYLGQTGDHGFLASDLVGMIREGFPGTLSKHVRYWGSLDSRGLRELYNASDLFVSLSTHNDEDFGMAPAEAMLCGRPLALTDWGGYASFAGPDPRHCALVPVRMGKEQVAPDALTALKILTRASDRRISAEEQAGLSEAARRYCSLESVAARLKTRLEDLSPTCFEGFTELFKKVGHAHRARKEAPFRSGSGYSNLYREVYASYI